MLLPLGAELLTVLIRPPGGAALTLPKGHIEPGETSEQTALRETREETGLRCDLIAPLDEIAYTFWSQARAARISKRVEFFLVRYRAGAPRPQAGEVDALVLATLPRAVELLTYPGDRRVMKRALAWPEIAGYGAGEANGSTTTRHGRDPDLPPVRQAPAPRGRPCMR
ncbi:MAG: NUDIX hydrolase [Thermoleophilia bacterium]